MYRNMLSPLARRPVTMSFITTLRTARAVGALLLGALAAPPQALGQAQPQVDAIRRVPEMLRGTFRDDYRIAYQISDTLFSQGSRLKYHVISWHSDEQYLIAQNDRANPADGALFTRIDWVLLTDMAPWTWAYCLTAYRAPTADSARATPPAKRDTPRTGCNGFPFSRMQRVDLSK